MIAFIRNPDQGLYFPIPGFLGDFQENPCEDRIRRKDDGIGSGDVLITHEYYSRSVTPDGTFWSCYNGNLTKTTFLASDHICPDAGVPYDYNISHWAKGKAATGYVVAPHGIKTIHVSKMDGHWTGTIRYFFKNTVLSTKTGLCEKVWDVRSTYTSSWSLDLSLASVINMMDAIPLSDHIPDDTPRIPGVGYTGFWPSDRYYCCDVKQDISNLSRCSHGELGWFNGVHVDGPNQLSSRGFALAFYDAIGNLPRAEQNLFANILECLDIVSSFRSGYSSTVLKDLNDVKSIAQEAWLAWRYSYTTTKSDIEEMSEVLTRMGSLSSQATLKSYGSFSEGDMSYKCEVIVPTSAILGKNLTEKCKSLGLKVSMTNIWDMIPYSFVVDWFLGVSDILGAIDGWLASNSIPYECIWYSAITHESDSSTHAYLRFSGGPPRLPHIAHHQASTRTWWMRVADGLSLFA